MKYYATVALTKSVLLVRLIGISFWANSQSIPVNTWRTHFNYTEPQKIIATRDNVFCAGRNSLFSISPESNEIRKLSKLDGLHGTRVSAMEYDRDHHALLIGYASGHLDIVSRDKIQPIDDLVISRLAGSKSIRAIALLNNKAFIGCDLGILVLDLTTGNTIENYFQIGEEGISVRVYELSMLGSRMFARTQHGIQWGDVNTNLRDFNYWTREPSTSDFQSLHAFAGNMYAIDHGSLMRWENTWIDPGIDVPAGAVKLFVTNNKLFTTAKGVPYELVGDAFRQAFELPEFDHEINDLIYAGGKYWIAESTLGLFDGNKKNFSPKGPIRDTFSSLKVVGNTLYGFHAPQPNAYDGREKVEGYSVFENGRWRVETIDGFKNISTVASFNGIRYFGSIGDGLYNERTKSILTNIPGSDVASDPVIIALGVSQALWVSSFNNNTPIHKMDKEGNWSSLASDRLFSRTFYSIDFSENGMLWMRNENGSITLYDPSKNQTGQITTSHGLPSVVRDVDITVEDGGWVATRKGPVFFPSASSFPDEKSAILPTFNNRTLFRGENVGRVVSDGGGRVWFSTNSGLWLFDASLSSRIAFFNESNSPLPSNTIYDLAYEGNTGELFISTDKGLVSYRTNSSFGERQHANVSIFPNPVRPDYTGVVGITGLARNVNIKITDINGTLVNELNANGGTASWNLLDLRSRKVVTGVYLIFSSSSDGEETFIGKIAVVR